MRVGDFYEVFGYGAVQVSELIDLTLTSRDMGLKHRVPMVGFPYHRADVYYDKLTDKGLTLVVAENDELTVKSVTKGTVNVHTGEVRRSSKGLRFFYCQRKLQTQFHLMYNDITKLDCESA